LVGIKEAARMVGVSRQTLAIWYRNGSFIRPVYDGTRPRWNRQAVDAWIRGEVRP
jgi:excisionase family DNA binding protein